MVVTTEHLKAEADGLGFCKAGCSALSSASVLREELIENGIMKVRL